jgi:hypothetical protein
MLLDINNESKGISVLIPHSFSYNRLPVRNLNVELCINFLELRKKIVILVIL